MKQITIILLLLISLSGICQVSPPTSHTIKVAGSGTSGGTTKYSTTEYGMLTDSGTANLYKFRVDSTVLESQERAVNRAAIITAKVLADSTALAAAIALKANQTALVDSSAAIRASVMPVTSIVKIVNDTTQLTAVKTITELTLPVSANKKYKVTAIIYTGCNNTGGLAIGVNGPLGTTIVGMATGTGTAFSNQGQTKLTTLNATGVSAVFNKANSSGGVLQITVYVTTSATAGNITLIFSSAVATQISTIYAGSTMDIQELN